MYKLILTLITVLLFAGSAIAEEKQQKHPKQVLFKNVHVWGGPVAGQW
jgi:hypothetical protein